MANHLDRGYDQICISMYLDDIERLDRIVEQIKSERGLPASRSAVIRYALRFFDAGSIPKSAFLRRKRQ